MNGWAVPMGYGILTVGHATPKSSRTRNRYLIPLSCSLRDVGELIEVEPLRKGAGERLRSLNHQPQSLSVDEAHITTPPRAGDLASPTALGQARGT
jgi:hypothetical protein